MSKGPKLNHIRRRFTTRDPLGIEGVATSLQAELCPVVNTVTPRAFYWPFMVWNYYDFLTNVSSDKWNIDNFDEPFLKKNDYYFVLSNLMQDNSDQVNLVGKEKTADYLSSNEEGPFDYKKDYFITRYGGMQYYNAGCITLGFITDRSADGKDYSFPRITEEIGKPMALAFEKAIRNTEYYQHYRLKNTSIPRKVLEEYGKVITLDLGVFSECKELLRKALFAPVNNINLNNKNLIDSANYLKFLSEQYNLISPSLSQMRNILYDYFSPRGDNRTYPDYLVSIIKGWECLVGRQYFVIAIELIWKYMISLLVKPMDLESWIRLSIDLAVSQWDFRFDLSSYVEECNYAFEEREQMIQARARGSRNIDNNIEIALKILFSVYNRFKERDDIDPDMLKIGEEVSILNLGKVIEEYKNKTICDFIIYIMTNWIVYRHQNVAFNKMLQGRDGYYFEFNDGMYNSRSIIPSPDFQGIRLIQLFQVMLDLDMITH